MHIKRVAVRNFRLLSDVEISLESSRGGEDDDPEVTTVVVGRNNSGKTSFTEIFRRFAKPARFRLEDFSSSAYQRFCDGHTAYLENADDQGPARAALPYIELRIAVGYDPSAGDYGPLADFIVDLDETADEAVVVARFELGRGKLEELFADVALVADDDASKAAFLTELRPKVRSLYTRTLRAEDPADATNTRELEWSYFERLFTISFISAQRGLDDVTDREVDVLAHLVERLFEAAAEPTAPSEDQEVVKELRSAVDATRMKLDETFKDQMAQLLPKLEEFGYPGLDGPPIEPEVTLAVERLLQNSTKMRYAGYLGVALPESYNGLGTRNLLSILLQLLAFQRMFVALGDGAGINLVFVEEPEAHLHPQMQEVFIRRLNHLAKASAGKQAWSVQFVVSTHSSHVANQAPFTSIRYFLAAPESATPLIRSTKVKDLSVVPTDGPAQRFLHQYLTLTRCDLFFADHAILVEGTAERLLLPAMIKEISGLPSRYISLLEVGGAYAHLFFPLLKFLELPALVITDIDSVDAEGKKIRVAEGERTSNATIKSWFDDKNISPEQLLVVKDEDKVDGTRRLAYQVPEDDGGPCGRTFEDAFILANRDLFGELEGATDLAVRAAEVAEKKAKSAFALHYAIEQTQWLVPRYILEGLQWLHALGPAVEPPGQTAVTQ